MTAYQRLEAEFARAAVLQEVLGILGWDTETMMPPGAIEARSEQLATLENLSHTILTAPEINNLLAEAADNAAGLDRWQQANLREMQRAYQRAVAIPSDLLVASTKASAKCQHIWRSARKDNDFAAVRDALAEVIRLQRQTGEALGAVLGVSPYDALLDRFDMGRRQEGLDRLFGPVAAALPGLIERAVAKQAAAPSPIRPAGPFAVDIQERLCRELLKTIGFDFDHGRLDVSAHPFSGGSFGDVRVTTRFSDDDFVESMMAVIHEGGHGLYEQGRPPDWWTQPVGAARGMGLHESQAMTLEWQAGKSDAFLSYLLPRIRDAFGGKGEAWGDDNLKRLILRVEPGLIRVNSDELTYTAHILVRYELEKAMIAGDLSVDDLPGAFNERVLALLGLRVPDDRRGCLQDIHWYGGAFGYFPMYLVGAMTAAQLFAAASKAQPDLLPSLAEGRFEPLVSWLREHVHGKASFRDSDEIMTEATGRPTTADDFLTHLERRYA